MNLFKEKRKLNWVFGCVVLGDACLAGRWCCVPVCRRRRSHFWSPDEVGLRGRHAAVCKLRQNKKKLSH